MNFENLLPIGTVVLLEESTCKVMITGLCQKKVGEETIYDYAGCLYPEGVMGPDKTFLFNGEQIERVYFIGYQDEQGLDYADRITAALQEYRKQMSGETEDEED